MSYKKIRVYDIAMYTTYTVLIQIKKPFFLNSGSIVSRIHPELWDIYIPIISIDISQKANLTLFITSS